VRRICPWALSRNNAVVHCCVSLTTQQFKQRTYQQHCYARDNRHGDVSMVTGLLSTDFCWYSQSCLKIAARRRACVFGYGLLFVGRQFVSGNCKKSTWVYTVDGEDSRSSGLAQASDGLYAEVLLWCASGPIARRWIVPTCVWKFQVLTAASMMFRAIFWVVLPCN
jgi:hypothetical protein